MNQNQAMLAAVLQTQKISGVEYECYRRGDEFDITDPATQAQVNNRAVPLHNNQIITAYDAPRNQTLLWARLRRQTVDRDFDFAASINVDIGAQAAQRNRNDLNQALANFTQLQRTHGNRLKCQ